MDIQLLFEYDTSTQQIQTLVLLFLVIPEVLEKAHAWRRWNFWASVRCQPWVLWRILRV